MKQFLTLVCSILFSLSFLKAQQLPLFGSDPEMHGLINPASVYSDFLTYERVVSGGTMYRSQWTGFPGDVTPKTLVAHGEYIYLGQEHSLVMGGYVQHDGVGITKNTGIYGRFAYIFTGNEPSEGGVSVGLNMGTVNWQLKTNSLLLTNPDDPNFPLANPSLWYLDIGMGVYAYKNLGEKGKYIYGGLSAPRLFDIRNSTDGSPQRSPHIYALAGFHYAPSNGSTVEISTWVRQLKNIPTQASLNVRVQMLKYVMLGGGIVSNISKPSDTPFFTLEAGTRLALGDRYFAKISYIRSFSSAAYWGSTHEVNVSFALEQ